MILAVPNKKNQIDSKLAFKLESGTKLDACIQGEEVDIKCTVRTDWMIPPEAFDEICMLIRIGEQKGKFWAAW